MIELALSDNLTTRLQAGAKAAADFSVPMAAIADVMRFDAQQNFETETAPDGTPWKPSRRAIEEGGRTLYEFGYLFGSLTASNDSNSAILGTNWPSAPTHQFGAIIRALGGANGGAKALKTPFGPRASVSIPARPFLGFGPALTADIEDILVAHLDQALNG